MKYQALLEGLEVSEVLFSSVMQDNQTMRIDSQYFKKVFLEFEMKNISTEPLSYFVKQGYRVVYENTKIIDREKAEKNNYPFFLQATDLDTPFIDKSNLFHVHREEWDRYPKGRVKKGEILIEVKGKLDKVSIVENDFPEYTLVSGSLFKLEVKENISKNLLLTYLISKYGVLFKERYSTNLLISYISKPDLYKVPVPIFCKELEKVVDNLFIDIFSCRKTSQEVYKKAEELLLNELKLTNFQPNEQGINVKSLKDSFLTSGRLDAEYYQPKFDAMIETIKQFNYDKLSNLVNIKKSIEPGSSAYQEDGIPFYRVSNLTTQGLSQPDIHLDRHQYAHVIKPKKDTVLLTKDGTVGMAYKVTQDIDGITSGAILHLTVKDKNKLLPDYLTLVLNSIVVQLQAERDAGGSIIQHWKPSEIGEVIIPLLDIETQKTIAELIQQSFALKSQSEQLLDDAKRLVEMAIEEGEERALVWYEGK